MPHLPELLAPAGDREQLDAALRYGADAVYLGGPALNLRAGTRGFSGDALISAVRDAHARNAAVYYCLNVLPREEHLPAIIDELERLPDAGVDALIVADPGVVLLARRHCPSLPLHLSTQANTANSAAVAFWRDMGVTRVNLARELDMRTMRRLVESSPGMEFEAFVHGAQCLALSGRCLLSAWLNNRSANLGACTHPCRFEYKGVALAVEEKTRPGEVAWEVVEDGPFHSSFWAPQDLCLVRYAHWFARVGMAALKVEGRMKSGGYVAQVVDVYRTAIDDVARRTSRGDDYIFELLNCASRQLTTGFFLGGGRRCHRGLPHDAVRHPLVARVEEPAGDGAWHVSVRSPWKATSIAEVLLPGMRRPELLPGTYRLENHRGETVDRLHPGMAGVLHCASADIGPGIYIRA